MSEENDPLARVERETVRVTLELPTDEAEFLLRYAAYRNMLNQVASRAVQVWSRKSAGEAFISAQVAAVRANMREIFEKLGEIPSAKDEKALLAYAKDALALTEKTTKKR